MQQSVLTFLLSGIHTRFDKANIVHTPQKKFSDCKDKTKLKFDEYLEELIKMIEEDGLQHFRIIDYWDKGEENNFLLRKNMMK